MHESWPWKRELKLLVAQLATWIEEFECDDDEKDAGPQREEAGFQIEKAMFLSAYIVRKLIENKKVADSIAEHQVDCHSSRYVGPHPIRIFGADIERDFDHKRKSKQKISLQKLCHELVHAKIFNNGTTREDLVLQGFWVCSDLNQDKRILFVDFSDWTFALRKVSENYPHSIRTVRDQVSGKLKIEVT